ncbi:cytochrome c [Beijerinckia sp. L45]|uniref:c-type cytochrome n=1 Tax=Beijerinckia sp. L45 TaxID=1641855 RepID=UPI00131DEA82|nr:c-type cytochrome [Beijerinckia sp. L45]
MRFAAICLALVGLSAPAMAQTVAERLPTCLSCHGAQGISDTPGIPSLAGQPADYLLVQLVLFRDKQRVSEVMNAMADGLSDDDLRGLADSMAKLAPPKASGPVLEAAVLDQGRGLVEKYRCGSCHAANLSGQEQIPRLAAQREDYLGKQLTDYKSNARAGYDPAMNEVAQEVQPADIPVLAKYIANLR